MGATNPNAGGAPGGGGKGGMGRNPGPGGNAQNNPGGGQQGPGQNYWSGPAPMSNDNGYGNFTGLKPDMSQFANVGQQFNGLGSAGLNQSFPGQTTGQSMGGAPTANWQSMLKSFGGGGMGRPDGFGGGGNISLDKGYFRPSNLSVPTPQPQEPVGGYINGQPAQFHHQAMALNKPQPQTTAAGLPAGGLLARLYGG